MISTGNTSTNPDANKKIEVTFQNELLPKAHGMKSKHKFHT